MSLRISPLIAVLLVPAAAAAFDGVRAKGTVDAIAADGFRGRKSGLEGGRMTEEYVAARFAEWGLRPAGDGGTFFHELPMLVTEERGASLVLVEGPLGPVEFLCGDDFALLTNSGSGEIEAEVVFAGHGLADGRREWNDYGDTDVSGRIVLIHRGTPENGYDWGEAGARDSTVTEAVRRGAVGVLFSRGDRAVAGAAIHGGSYFPGVPMASVSARVVENLLRGTGSDRSRYKAELKEGPVPFETGRRLRFRADVAPVPEGRARNVAGRVPGADPDLREEIVLIGGHMDHVGVDGFGRVYNGANDNASGTSIVMELARSFAAGPPPKRTMVFITFAGEEQGLLGSIAFADEPSFDLGTAVAMVNFDMGGHGDGKVGIGADGYYEMLDSFRASLDTARADSLRIARPWGDGSDHAPFRWKGIPVFNVWSEGEHRFYHSVDDDTEWVSAEVLGSVGRMAEGWLRTLADHPAPLLVDHRAGRTLLHASDQVDFDGRMTMNGGAPRFVRGRVRWFDAADFPREPFIAALGDLRIRTGGDSLALVYSLGEVQTEARSGKRSVLLGLEEGDGGRVSKDHVHLLGDMHVSFTRWLGEQPVSEETEYLEDLAGEGVALLVPAAKADPERFPAEGKAYVRFFPGRGERIDDPESFPRKGVLFVASLEGHTDAGEIAAEIGRLGWDRVHVDLVPWLAASPEEEVWPWIEALRDGGGFKPFQMKAILGGNLNRL
ncbi:MAG: M28 family peptidase [Candidatus Eisenbacteria bacterium]